MCCGWLWLFLGNFNLKACQKCNLSFPLPGSLTLPIFPIVPPFPIFLSSSPTFICIHVVENSWWEFGQSSSVFKVKDQDNQKKSPWILCPPYPHAHLGEPHPEHSTHTTLCLKHKVSCRDGRWGRGCFRVSALFLRPKGFFLFLAFCRPFWKPCKLPWGFKTRFKSISLAEDQQIQVLTGIKSLRHFVAFHKVMGSD